MQIDQIGAVGGVGAPAPLEPPEWLTAPRAVAGGVPGADFAKELLTQVQGLQGEASKAVRGFATGDGSGLQEAILASEKAGIAFQFMNQVRNKVVQAYQEVMRMQV